MIKVYDNVIPQSALKSLDNYLTYEYEWHLSVDSDIPECPLSLGGTIERKYFSEGFQYLLSLIREKGYNTDRIYRNYVNCFRKGDNPQYHTDPGGNSYLFYTNSKWKRHWGSPTKFKGKFLDTIVYPKPGRLIVFDSQIKHKGVSPTMFMPFSIAGRFSVVFHEQA